MGHLIVNGNKYLINTSMCEAAQDEACNIILKGYPSDATIDFVELW
jgi:hypothetical protein